MYNWKAIGRSLRKKTQEGPKIKVTKKRIIKKKLGDNVEQTKIVTVQEENKGPKTSVNVLMLNA